MADSQNKKKANVPDTAENVVTRNDTVSISDIEKLFSLMRENEIAELEIEQYKTKIHIVSKSAPVAQQAPIYMQPGLPAMQMMPMPGQAPAAAAPAEAAAAPASSSAPAAQPAAQQGDAGDSLPANARTVLSPMVGTFYRSASPDAPPFVREGEVVNEDTVLCIIEAMKLMNEIKAETKGKILRVLVENGMPVEFNQPLFVLEP